MTVEEINEVIQKEMEYNEYDYQKENNILIKKKTRAEGLNKILYQCPHCKKEGKMYSKGHELYCEECGKRWNFNEDGTLRGFFSLKMAGLSFLKQPWDILVSNTNYYMNNVLNENFHRRFHAHH